MNINMEELMETLPVLAMEYGLKIFLALVIFLVGKWLARVIANGLERSMEFKKVDPTVSRFTRNILYYVLLVVVIIAALGQLGIQTASFVAIVAAAGLAIGLALQGSLANFAAGVLLILFRPFKSGDYVEAGGTAGSVKEISLLFTILVTPDNKEVTVPNGSVMSDHITNYSALPTRRVDLVIGVSYSADLALVKKTLQELVDEDERILKEPTARIAVQTLADSSINFVLRPWVNSADYWEVFFDLTEKVKLRFDERGIEIPFPQMDVHLDK